MYGDWIKLFDNKIRDLKSCDTCLSTFLEWHFVKKDKSGKEGSPKITLLSLQLASTPVINFPRNGSTQLNLFEKSANWATIWKKVEHSKG